MRVGSVDIPPGFCLRSATSIAGIGLGSAQGQWVEVQPEGGAYRLLDSG